MTLTIEVDDALAEVLREKAERRGKDIETYLLLLAEKDTNVVAKPPLTEEEWEEAFEELSNLIGPDTPPLSDYAVSRESIYEDDRLP